jgi:hypothetical protein
MNLLQVEKSQERRLRLMDILSLDATDQLQALAALRISARELPGGLGRPNGSAESKAERSGVA